MFLSKKTIQKYTPQQLLLIYHYILSLLGAFWYRLPSEKLIVVGITGTSGKSTTVQILTHLLEFSGHRTGYLSTIGFKIGKEFDLNNLKMTMLGRFQSQRFLRKMVQAGCTHAIVETTSQGIEQYRHRTIHYDLVLLTNLYPEHIEAHGSFENYKKAKLKLFSHLAQSKPKKIKGITHPRTIVVNGESKEASEFLNFSVERKFVFGRELQPNDWSGIDALSLEAVQTSGKGSRFRFDGQDYFSPLLGVHNIYNVVAALSVGKALGLEVEVMKEALVKLPAIPGRLEAIDEGQDFGVIVDYAFEPKAMHNLYETVEGFSLGKIIQVLGGTGGGRDRARRPILGKMAAEKAAYVVVTNEDPYDDDPYQIMDEVASGAKEGGKVLNQDLFMILDRRQAIAKAFSLAKKGDLVLITGKGSEQAIAGPGGRLLAWDDRKVAKEQLKRLLHA